MEDWHAHIQHTHEDKKKESWCGKIVSNMWCFQSIDHAAYSKRLKACPDCAEAILKALKEE